MTCDDARAKCIEAMKLAMLTTDPIPMGMLSSDDLDDIVVAAFESLRNVPVTVNLLEATNEMVEAGWPHMRNLYDAWRAMSAAGNLINSPEKKP